MEWVETTGRTVEEAKDAALDQLGVDESDAEFEVLSEAKTGLFGRVKEQARVKARVKPATPRNKEQSQRRRRPRRDKAGAGGDSDSRQSKSESTDSGSEGHEQDRPASPRKPRDRKQKASTQSKSEGAIMGDEDVSLEQQGQVAEEFLTGFFATINAQAAITSELKDEDGIVKIGVNGDGLGHLIGPRGATLHAIQEITRTVVQRKTGSRSARIVVDLAGYREKRQAALAEFVRKVAAEVLAEGGSKSLEPMNPADRKIVHDTINEMEGVSTTSEGEEPRRRVVISAN